MKTALFFLPVSLALLTSCGGGEPPRKSAAPAPAPVAVQTVAVATQTWPGTYEATGSVRARSTTTVSSKVMGYIQQVSAQVGDHVREGQVLVTLEVRDLEAGIRSAEAARAEAQSAAPEIESATAAAKASLDLAQTTFKRMEDLAAKKSISSQEFDEASARLKSAQANYEMARARRLQLDSRIAQTEQGIRSATIMRDYSKILAPISGLVTAKSAEPGVLATPGAPLLTIEHEGGYRLEVSVDESRLPSVRVGQPVEVALEALDRKLNARVGEIVPAVDAASRSYIVKIDLPALSQLRSGAFGRAAFPASARAVLAVPPAAVVERGQLQSVFVAEDGAAHMRLITIGQHGNSAVEVLSGLTAGEKVVSPVPPGLQDGARVEVRQ